jgi:hypothetical protein
VEFRSTVESLTALGGSSGGRYAGCGPNSVEDDTTPLTNIMLKLMGVNDSTPGPDWQAASDTLEPVVNPAAFTQCPVDTDFSAEVPGSHVHSCEAVRLQLLNSGVPLAASKQKPLALMAPCAVGLVAPVLLGAKVNPVAEADEQLPTRSCVPAAGVAAGTKQVWFANWKPPVPELVVAAAAPVTVRIPAAANDRAITTVFIGTFPLSFV